MDEDGWSKSNGAEGPGVCPDGRVVGVGESPGGQMSLGGPLPIAHPRRALLSCKLILLGSSSTGEY